jgi:hypothetical protein
LKSDSRDLENRSLLQYALFRWESAVVLAMTLVLVVFIPDPFRGVLTVWRWWMWIILGGLAEVLIVLTTVSDPGVRARIASDRLRAQFDLDAIVDVDIRQQVAGVLDLWEQMKLVLAHADAGTRKRDGRLRASLQAIADDAALWIGALYGLARRLSDYRDQSEPGSPLYKHKESISGAIPALEERLARTADAQARAQLEREIAGRQALLDELERLDGLAEKAASRLASSHGALEAIYTQMQLVAARGVEGRRVQQLRGVVADHIRSLSELDQEIAERYERVSERA